MDSHWLLEMPASPWSYIHLMTQSHGVFFSRYQNVLINADQGLDHEMNGDFFVKYNGYHGSDPGIIMDNHGMLMG